MLPQWKLVVMGDLERCWFVLVTKQQDGYGCEAQCGSVLSGKRGALGGGWG